MDEVDIRDRLARAEQDIKNHKENFSSFKADDFGSLKREVHSMRNELNTKIDELRDLLIEVKEISDQRVHAINVTMAKWVGFAGAMFFVAQFILDRIVK